MNIILNIIIVLTLLAAAVVCVAYLKGTPPKTPVFQTGAWDEEGDRPDRSVGITGYIARYWQLPAGSKAYADRYGLDFAVEQIENNGDEPPWTVYEWQIDADNVLWAFGDYAEAVQIARDDHYIDLREFGD